MRNFKKAVSAILALSLVLALALPALADEVQTQAQAQVRVQVQEQVRVHEQVYGAQLPPELVAMVNSLSLEQLKALGKLVRERVRELAPAGESKAEIEFAGVVTQVYGDTFTVVKGGKGRREAKTFTVTPDTVVEGKGALKGVKEIKPGAMVKVKATAGGEALEVHLLPAKKAEAVTQGKAPQKKPVEKKPRR